MDVFGDGTLPFGQFESAHVGKLVWPVMCRALRPPDGCALSFALALAAAEATGGLVVGGWPVGVGLPSVWGGLGPGGCSLGRFGLKGVALGVLGVDCLCWRR